MLTAHLPLREADPTMSDMIPQTGTVARFGSGVHETSEDVSLGIIMGFAVALVALCVVTAGLLAGVMWWVQVGVDREQAHRPVLFGRTEGFYGDAGPAVLGENPRKDYRKDPSSKSVSELKKADDAIGADAYGWVEPGKIARIPIERAIAILGDKNELPKMPAAAPATEPTPSDAVRKARENPAPQPPVPAATPKGS